MRSRRRFLRTALAVAVVAVLGVLVMPGRLWFGQREDIASAKAQLTELRADHAKLVSRVHTLSSPDRIEREARASFGWVHVGDEIYTVTPEPPSPVPTPLIWLL